MFRNHYLFAGLIALITGLLAFFSTAVIEQRHAVTVADHMLEQVNNRALQDFYELADQVRDHIADEEVELPSNLEPFVSQRLTMADSWQLNVNLNEMLLNVVPSLASGSVVDIRFYYNDQQQRIILDVEAWIQALCDDLGYGTVSFMLAYRDQPVVISGGHDDRDDWQVFRQDDFIFPELSLLLDRSLLVDNIYTGLYSVILTSIATPLALLLSFIWIRQKNLQRLSEEARIEVESELEKTSDILRTQMQVTAHSQKELLKRNYELQDLNRHLEDARHQAQFSERLASLGEISAGIVHEINNPIAYIGSNLRELEIDLNALRSFINTLDKVSDCLDVKSEFYQALLSSYQELNVQEALQEAPERLDDCIKGIERVRKIVQDMKRLGNNGDCEKKLCNLNDDINSVINIAASRIKGDIKLKTYLIDLPDLNCNASQISQVLTNILVNAIQALGERSGEITFTERLQGNSIILEVCDDGPGMDEGTAKHVFEPFFTTKESGKGTGMGLSLSYKIIAEHQGWIDLKTAPGKGACFIIHLPLSSTVEAE